MGTRQAVILGSIISGTMVLIAIAAYGVSATRSSSEQALLMEYRRSICSSISAVNLRLAHEMAERQKTSAELVQKKVPMTQAHAAARDMYREEIEASAATLERLKMALIMFDIAHPDVRATDPTGKLTSPLE